MGHASSVAGKTGANMDRDIAIREIEKCREKLLALVNTKIDALIAEVNNDEPDTDAGCTECMVYPLGINPAIFKGTKPAAIYFGDEKVDVKTWRSVYGIVLQRCAGNPEKLEALMYLRGKICGRSRFILASTPDRMDVPLKLADGLFAECYFDTEWLMRTLTDKILSPAGYEFGGISVSVMPRKRG